MVDVQHDMIQKWIFQGDSLDISYTQKELGNTLRT